VPVDAFISLEGAGFPAADVLREQLGPQLAAAPDLAAASERIIAALLSGRVDDDVPAVLAPLYRPSVQPYLISWFRYDPRVEIAKVRCPVTVVQGTADIQVGVQHGQALAAAHPGSTFVTIIGMSHVLKPADAMSREEQIAKVYADPAVPIEPGVVDAIVHASGLGR